MGKCVHLPLPQCRSWVLLIPCFFLVHRHSPLSFFTILNVVKPGEVHVAFLSDLLSIYCVRFLNYCCINWTCIVMIQLLTEEMVVCAECARCAEAMFVSPRQ
jgi:hypothetical protein